MSLLPSFSWKCRRKGVLILTTSRTYYYDTFALKQRKTFVFEKTNSSSNDNENCLSFILFKTTYKDSYPTCILHTIQIQYLDQTHICMKSVTIFYHILETIWKIHQIIPFFEMLLTQFCWYEKYVKSVKSVKRWKSLLYQSCFFLLKTRVNFFGCAGKTLFLTEL